MRVLVVLAKSEKKVSGSNGAAAYMNGTVKPSFELPRLRLHAEAAPRTGKGFGQNPLQSKDFPFAGKTSLQLCCLTSTSNTILWTCFFVSLGLAHCIDKHKTLKTTRARKGRFAVAFLIAPGGRLGRFRPGEQQWKAILGLW